MTEPINCAVCGEPHAVASFALSQRPYYRCRSCGVFFYQPFPSDEELQGFYDEQWQGEGTRYREFYCNEQFESRNDMLNFQTRLALLRELGYKGHILDVGCSTGTFLCAAAEHGWRCTGVEIAEAAANKARERAACPIYTGTVDSVDLPDGEFDVVHVSQVLEHVREPAGLLRRVRGLLRPGGCLVAALPIIDRRMAALTHLGQRLIPVVSRGRTPPYPWAIEHPLHLYAHSPDSLRRLFAAEDYRIQHERMVMWQDFSILNLKWRVFYHGMNLLAHMLGTGLNIEVYAVKDAVASGSKVQAAYTGGD